VCPKIVGGFKRPGPSASRPGSILFALPFRHAAGRRWPPILWLSSAVPAPYGRSPPSHFRSDTPPSERPETPSARASPENIRPFGPPPHSTSIPPQNLFAIPDDLLSSSLPQLLFHVLNPAVRLFPERLPPQGPQMLHRRIPVHHPLRTLHLGKPLTPGCPAPDERHTPTSSAETSPHPQSPPNTHCGGPPHVPSRPRVSLPLPPPEVTPHPYFTPPDKFGTHPCSHGSRGEDSLSECSAHAQ